MRPSQCSVKKYGSEVLNNGNSALLEDGVEVGRPLVEHPVLELLDRLVLLHLLLGLVGLHRGRVRVLLLLEREWEMIIDDGFLGNL